MSTEQIGFYEIPNNPADRQRILNAIENCRAAKVRILSEQTFISDTVKEIAKDFGIKAADLNKLINDRSKGTFGESVTKAERYQDLYESLFPNSLPEAKAEMEDEEEAPRNADFLAQKDEELDAMFSGATQVEEATA